MSEAQNKTEFSIETKDIDGIPHLVVTVDGEEFRKDPRSTDFGVHAIGTIRELNVDVSTALVFLFDHISTRKGAYQFGVAKLMDMGGYNRSQMESKHWDEKSETGVARFSYTKITISKTLEDGQIKEGCRVYFAEIASGQALMGLVICGDQKTKTE